MEYFGVRRVLSIGVELVSEGNAVSAALVLWEVYGACRSRARPAYDPPMG